MMTAQYAVSAAQGMVDSMAHYGNTNPPCGDGKVGTPAWYANRLGKVFNANQLAAEPDPALSTLPGDSSTWWGDRWLAYAEQILRSI